MHHEPFLHIYSEPRVSIGDVTTRDIFQTHQYACYIVPNYLLVNGQADLLIYSICQQQLSLKKGVKISTQLYVTERKRIKIESRVSN